MTDNSHISTYKSLSDIRLRKEQLREELLSDDRKIKTLWTTLFRQPDVLRRDTTPSRRISGLFNMGAGVLDGLILGWKLYHKFKK